MRERKRARFLGDLCSLTNFRPDYLEIRGSVSLLPVERDMNTFEMTGGMINVTPSKTGWRVVVDGSDFTARSVDVCDTYHDAILFASLVEDAMFDGRPFNRADWVVDYPELNPTWGRKSSRK